MSQPASETTIEIENENEDENEEVNEKEKIKTTKLNPERVTITRKKVSELTEKERNQLIQDAQKGLENDYYTVKMFKNGSTRICLKKQSKAQQVLTEAKENQQIPTTSKRYYTDNQLLMEHVIALETQYNKLNSKHKKLKKRYNELEGYLYADDETGLKENPEKQEKQENEKEEISEKQEQKQEKLENQSLTQDQIQEQLSHQPQVRYRYVRSWRQINANQ